MQRNEKRTQRHKKKHRVIVCQTLCFFIKTSGFPPKSYSNILLKSAAEMFLFSNVTCVFKAEASFVSTTRFTRPSMLSFFFNISFCIVVEDFFGHAQHTVLCKLCTGSFLCHIEDVILFNFNIVGFHQLLFNQMPSQFFDALVVIVFYEFFRPCPGCSDA